MRGEAKVSISAKADGWTKELPAFGYAVVDEEGETAEEGEITPGEALSLTLPDGVYAVSITSIPTKADGAGTWAPPASQMLQVVDGEATPSEISLTLLPVDPADAEAVEAVTANLPEAERDAARQLLAAKREDPKADRVEVAPARPQPAPSEPGDGKPARKWGVVKEAWDERVLVSAAWDETVVVKPAWTEDKLVKEAWTETINHPAQYQTVTHPAETKNVHHDAVYGWI